MANEPKGIIQVDDREIARLNAIHEHASREKAMDIGKIGLWLGTRDNALLYLAAGVLFFAIFVAAFISIFEPTSRADIIKALISIATLAA
jgi:hypothetical protein